MIPPTPQKLISYTAPAVHTKQPAQHPKEGTVTLLEVASLFMVHAHMETYTHIHTHWV